MANQAQISQIYILIETQGNTTTVASYHDRQTAFAAFDQLVNDYQLIRQTPVGVPGTLAIAGTADHILQLIERATRVVPTRKPNPPITTLAARQNWVNRGVGKLHLDKLTGM